MREAEPDVVVASAGDILTLEALVAVAILRDRVPELKIRFVNVVDLYQLQPDMEHPHGLSDRDFNSLFTRDKPVIFNFHGYSWLIHKFTYHRTNGANIHVRGYKEKGNINTPLELAIRNQVDASIWRSTCYAAMHDRPPLRIASTTGRREAGLLTGLESLSPRRTTLVVKRDVHAAGGA